LRTGANVNGDEHVDSTTNLQRRAGLQRSLLGCNGALRCHAACWIATPRSVNAARGCVPKWLCCRHRFATRTMLIVQKAEPA
jgi:hypothetical protein